MRTTLQILCALSLAATAFAAPPDVAGQWKWTLDRNGETIDIEMHLTQEGSKLAGKVTGPENREFPIQAGKISDDGKLAFHIEIPRDSEPMKISFTGRAEGDKIAGRTEYTTGSGETRDREWNPKRAARHVSGQWASVFKRSDGTPMESTLRLKQEGAKITGAQSFNDNEAEIRDGKVTGDEVTFRILRERDGRTVTAKYRGKVQKDGSIQGEIESDWTGEVRKLEWEAKRTR